MCVPKGVSADGRGEEDGLHRKSGCTSDSRRTEEEVSVEVVGDRGGKGNDSTTSSVTHQNDRE